jgi:hypothetical protein
MHGMTLETSTDSPLPMLVAITMNPAPFGSTITLVKLRPLL